MKYIGFLLFFCAALIAVRIYTENERKRLSECREFISFLKHIRIKMSCFLSSFSEAAKDFSSDILTHVGFLDKLSETGSLNIAYKESEKYLSLSKEERCALERFFKNTGSGYLEDEMRLIDSALAELSEIDALLSDEVPKRIKVAWVMLAAFSSGVLLLII